MAKIIRNEKSAPSDCCQHVCNATTALYAHMVWIFFCKNVPCVPKMKKLWSKILTYVSSLPVITPNNKQYLTFPLIEKLCSNQISALIGDKISRPMILEVFGLNLYDAASQGTSQRGINNATKKQLPDVCHIPCKILQMIWGDTVLNQLFNQQNKKVWSQVPFQVIPVPADGNCLYHAIIAGTAVKENEEKLNVQHLRSQLHEFVQKHKQLAEETWSTYNFRSSGSNSYNEWKLNLITDGTWGGYIEMILLCNLLKTRFVSICFRDKVLEMFDSYSAMETKPLYSKEDMRNVDNTIFLWNHRLAKPKESIPLGQLPDHYTLLKLDPVILDRRK